MVKNTYKFMIIPLTAAVLALAGCGSANTSTPGDVSQSDKSSQSAQHGATGKSNPPGVKAPQPGASSSTHGNTSTSAPAADPVKTEQERARNQARRDRGECASIAKGNLTNSEQAIVKALQDVANEAKPRIESGPNGLGDLIKNKLNGDLQTSELVQAFALGAKLDDKVCPVNIDGLDGVTVTLTTSQEGSIMSTTAHIELNRLIVSETTRLNGYQAFTDRTRETAMSWPR